MSATGGFSFGTPGTSAATGTGFGFGTTNTAPATTQAGGFPFGGNTATSAAPTNSAFSFGNTTASTAPAAGAGFSFGTTAPPAAAAPAGGFPFGGTPATSTAAPAPAPGAFSFGASPAATSIQAPVAPFSFGTAPAATTTNQPAGGFSFGGGGVTSTAPAPGSSFSFSTTAPAAQQTGMFGTPAPASSGGFSFGGTPAASTQSAGLTLAGGSIPGGNPMSGGGEGTMTYAELEKHCNEWKKELEAQEEAFLKQATQINAWDRLIHANADKITSLNEYMSRVKGDQERLDQELDFVFAQQKELEEMLAPLEIEANAMKSTSIQHHTDAERDTTYNTATKVNAQLRSMSESIKEIIDYLNSSNKSATDNSPINQISKILNAHMDALQYIQNNIGTLQQKTDDVNALLSTARH